jgi:hypothetical protein
MARLFSSLLMYSANALKYCVSPIFSFEHLNVTRGVFGVIHAGL